MDEGAIVILIGGNEVVNVSTVIVDVVVVMLVEAVVVDIRPGVEMVVPVTFVIAVALVSFVLNDVALVVSVFVFVVVLLELLAELVVIAFFRRVVFIVVADMALSTWGIATLNRPKKGWTKIKTLKAGIELSVSKCQ